MSAALGSRSGGHGKGQKGDLDLSDAVPVPTRISPPIMFLRCPGERQASVVLDRVMGGRQPQPQPPGCIVGPSPPREQSHG